MKLIYMEPTIQYMISQGHDCTELIASGVTKKVPDSKILYLLVDIL